MASFQILAAHLLFIFCLVILSTCTFGMKVADEMSRIKQRFLVEGNTITVTVNSKSPIHLVSDKFISVTMDTGAIQHRQLGMFVNSSTRIKNLARALGPAYMRVGGTSADDLIFRDHTSHGFTMSEHEFDSIMAFAKTVGWEVLFDLNLLHRSGDKWDPSNAQVLLKYAASKGYVIQIELGNEPNAYHYSGRPVDPDPAQIGRDYAALRHVMDSIPPFNHRYLIGPSPTRLFTEDYMHKFLSTGAKSLSALGLHHYYMDGKTATEQQFMDPNVLNDFKVTIDHAHDYMNKYGRVSGGIWMTETSSAYGGGSPLLSRGFIAGFLWLDKLGLAASNGVGVVCRQSFMGGSYALIDHYNGDAFPDYWLSLLFKRLVGRKVLQVTSSEHNNRFRIYAHCSADPKQSTGITFYFQNMYDSEVKLNIAQYANHSFLLYILTAGGDGSLTSQKVNLNGHEIHMSGEKVPNLPPVHGQGWPVKIPKHSIGFLVSPFASVQACQ